MQKILIFCFCCISSWDLIYVAAPAFTFTLGQIISNYSPYSIYYSLSTCILKVSNKAVFRKNCYYSVWSMFHSTTDIFSLLSWTLNKAVSLFMYVIISMNLFIVHFLLNKDIHLGSQMMLNENERVSLMVFNHVWKTEVKSHSIKR